jgi:hypothetical protein
MVGVVVNKSFGTSPSSTPSSSPSRSRTTTCADLHQQGRRDVTGKKRAEVLGKPCRNWGADICGTERCGVTCLKRGQQTSTSPSPASIANFQVDTAFLKDTAGAAGATSRSSRT